MGCDIHLYKEKFVDGKWLTADEWTEEYGYKDVPYEKTYSGRNYNLFGLLSAGVRTVHTFSMKQRGLPFDVSPEVLEAKEICDGDGHSHSFLFLHELKALQNFINTKTVEIKGMKAYRELKKLNESIKSGDPDWQLLYPYCQNTNAPNYQHFEVNVPAKFIIGDGLEEIITLFDGLDGENHRIVFWFDN